MIIVRLVGGLVVLALALLWFTFGPRDADEATGWLGAPGAYTMGIRVVSALIAAGAAWLVWDSVRDLRA